MNINDLNKAAYRYIKKYQGLNINNNKVDCPYFINNVGLNLKVILKKANLKESKIKEITDLYKSDLSIYGKYQGKGTPEQIESAVISVQKKSSVDLKGANSVGIKNFMTLYGIGIDCSGLVYNTLLQSFTQFGTQEKFINSLSWAGDKKTPSRAGTFVFVGKASKIIQPKNIQPLDIIIIKKLTHMGLVVKNKGKLYVAQSNLDDNGVSLSRLEILENTPKFYYKTNISKDWNTLYKQGKFEFRRLTFLLNQK